MITRKMNTATQIDFCGLRRNIHAIGISSYRPFLYH